MGRIHEAVTIRASAADVWKVVHLDLDDMPRWAGYVHYAEYLDGWPPGAGSRLRYQLALPAGAPSLVLQQTLWEPPSRCQGLFVGGPVRGSWSYSYAEQDGGTELTYDADYELTGVLKVAGGMLKGRYEQGIRDALRSLKAYIEGR